MKRLSFLSLLLITVLSFSVASAGVPTIKTHQTATVQKHSISAPAASDVVSLTAFSEMISYEVSPGLHRPGLTVSLHRPGLTVSAEINSPTASAQPVESFSASANESVAHNLKKYTVPWLNDYQKFTPLKNTSQSDFRFRSDGLNANPLRKTHTAIENHLISWRL